MTSQNDNLLEFVPARNPVQRVHPDVLQRLRAAQASPFQKSFRSAADLLERALAETRIRVPVPPKFREEPACGLADVSFQELYGRCQAVLAKGGITAGEVLHLNASNIAQRIHLLRAFTDPDAVLESVLGKVIEIVEGFPKKAEDIEVGRNPGDVLDPYILSATQLLLYEGSLADGIGATVAHKALMMIEGLLGHLHEDIIGEFRGNIRSPEPRGFHQEMLDPFTNPFPGADIVQPPAQPGDKLRFHQVKSKTGSAKGGDARRLGEQLHRLQEYYGGETYYDALIGNTLRGHRSMKGVLRASPDTVVLVGAAAFRELTGSSVGPHLLMRVYQNAFSEAARRTGYGVKRMAKAITDVFRARAEAAGEEFSEVLMRSAIDGDRSQQDSRAYKPPSRDKNA